MSDSKDTMKFKRSELVEVLRISAIHLELRGTHLAQLVASLAHCGQVDKAGKPYIGHVRRVAAKTNSTEACIVALLHDVVEDSALTPEDLKCIGFSDEVVEAVACLTKLPGESKLGNALVIRRNALAREVKLADLEDNMDLSRLGMVSGDDIARNAEYAELYAFLRNN